MVIKWRIVAATILLVAVGGVAWYYVTGTPQYSLYCLKKALQQKDLDAVEYYVDVDAVADAVVTDIMKVMNEQMDRELKDNPFAGLAQGFMALVEPQLRTMAKHKLREGMREGINVNGQEPDWRNTHLESVKREGKVAEVTLKAGGVDQDLRLTLRQSPDRHWRVVAFPTFGELLRQAYEESKLARPEGSRRPGE